MPTTITLTFSDADAPRLAAAASTRGWDGTGDPVDFLRRILTMQVSEMAVEGEYNQARRAAIESVQMSAPLESHTTALQEELTALQQEVAQYRGTVGTDAEEARERAIDRRIAEIREELGLPQ